jgi:hypothetical protein
MNEIVGNLWNRMMDHIATLPKPEQLEQLREVALELDGNIEALEEELEFGES